jgi:hypothetical protein
MTPEEIVQRQLDAYNARNVEAWLATDHPQAEHFLLHGERIAYGHAELRIRIAARFSEPDLHAELLARITMANVVVDHERIRRNFANGVGHVEMVCIYETEGELIRKATFATHQIPA